MFCTVWENHIDGFCTVWENHIDGFIGVNRHEFGPSDIMPVKTSLVFHSQCSVVIVLSHYYAH